MSFSQISLISLYFRDFSYFSLLIFNDLDCAILNEINVKVTPEMSFSQISPFSLLFSGFQLIHLYKIDNPNIITIITLSVLHFVLLDMSWSGSLLMPTRGQVPLAVHQLTLKAFYFNFIIIKTVG